MADISGNVVDTESIAALFPVSATETDRVSLMAEAFLNARRVQDEAEVEAKKAAAACNDAEIDLLQAMKDARIKSLKIEHDGSVIALTETKTVYYSVPAETVKDGDFYAWLLENQGHDLIKSTMHHSSLSAFCRELVEAKKTLHEAVKIAERKSVRVKRD